MIDSQQESEGIGSAGRYGLGRCVGQEGAAVFYQTTFGPERLRALLKLVPADPATGEEQLALWEEAAALSHPHLLPLLDHGRMDESGEPFVYAVFEYPDDRLAGALAHGPLSGQEARDVADAALAALGYLHARDLAHTAVDAEHVVAVGDQIKLASDTLRHCGEAGASAAEDLLALGAMLYELLTGRRLGPGEEPDLEGVAEPLRSLIARSVEPDAARRWTVAEAQAWLNPSAQAVAVEEPAAEAAVHEEPAHEEPAILATPALETAATREAAEPARTEAPIAVPSLGLPKRSPALPLLLAAAGAVVVAVIMAVTQRPAAETRTAAVTPVAAPASAVATPNPPPPAAPAAAAVAPPVRVGSADAPAPAEPVKAAAPPAHDAGAAHGAETPPARPAGVAHRSESRPRDNWRVVAYTYNRRDQAEHKVQTINRLKPGFEATLFAPRDPDQAPFFVALGGRMSRERATALQKKARASGLPRDTFTRNF